MNTRKTQPNIQNLFTHTAAGARILQAFREARLQPTSKQPGGRQMSDTVNSAVQVAIFTPDNGNRPYVYGVFRVEDDAIEHWRQWGDKDGTLRVTTETLVERRKPRAEPATGTLTRVNRMRHPQHDQIPKEEHENTFQHWQQPTYPGIKRYTTQDRSLGRAGRQDTGLSLQQVGEITDWTEEELDAISSLQVGAAVTVGGIHVTRTE